MFTSRVELLPEDETTAEHEEAQRTEALQIEADRNSKEQGLFKGAFQMVARTIRMSRAPIRDVEDGVERCPNCTWELEDGLCFHCSYGTHADDSDYSGEDSLGTRSLASIPSSELDGEEVEPEDVQAHHDRQHGWGAIGNGWSPRPDEQPFHADHFYADDEFGDFPNELDDPTLDQPYNPMEDLEPATAQHNAHALQRRPGGRQALHHHMLGRPPRHTFASIHRPAPPRRRSASTVDTTDLPTTSNHPSEQTDYNSLSEGDDTATQGDYPSDRDSEDAEMSSFIDDTEHEGREPLSPTGSFHREALRAHHTGMGLDTDVSESQLSGSDSIGASDLETSHSSDEDSLTPAPPALAPPGRRLARRPARVILDDSDEDGGGEGTPSPPRPAADRLDRLARRHAQRARRMLHVGMSLEVRNRQRP